MHPFMVVIIVSCIMCVYLFIYRAVTLINYIKDVLLYVQQIYC
jgi:hypothetical protein